MEKTYKRNAAFMQYVQAFIGIMVVCIIAISVTVPIVQEAIDDANLTGTNDTLAGIIPTLILVLVVVLIVGAMAL